MDCGAEAVDFLDLIWIVPLLPLVGAVGNGAVSQWGGASRRVRDLLALVGPGAAWVLGWGLVVSWWFTEPGKTTHVVEVLRWIPGGELAAASRIPVRFELAVGFQLDGLSAVMVALVVFVGFLVHFFAVGFEERDRGEDRSLLFSYMNLLLAGSLTVVLAGNLPTCFAGWEGVALGSFLLIASSHRVGESAAAGTRAFLIGRIGAAALLLAMAVAVVFFGTLDVEGLRVALTAEIAGGVTAPATMLGFLLVLVAVIGAAQLPFHVWLTESVDAPVSASALIISVATLATGAHVILRFGFLVAASPVVTLTVAIVGGASVVFAAAVALVQRDVRKLLAHVAVCQFGLVFLGIGVGATSGVVFHLVLSSLSMMCLVLGSGVVVRFSGGGRDLRRMGGMRELAPVTFWTSVTAAAVIAGVPPLAGFMSRDAILARLFEAGMVDFGAFGGVWFTLWGLGLVGTTLMVFGIFRFVFMVFFGEFRGDDDPGRSPVESSPAVVLSLGTPALLVLFGGTAAGLSGGAGMSAGIEWTLTAMTVTVVIAAIGAAARSYLFDPGFIRAEHLARRFSLTRRLLLEEVWVDDLYRVTVVGGIQGLARSLDGFDTRVVDGAVNGVRHFVVGFSWLSGIFDLLVVDGLLRRIGGAIDVAGLAVRRSQVVFVQGFVVVMIIGAALFLGIVFVANL